MTTPERSAAHFLLQGGGWRRTLRVLEAAGYAVTAEGAATGRVTFLDTPEGRLEKRGVRLLLWEERDRWCLKGTTPSGREEELCRGERDPPEGPVVDGRSLGLGDRTSLWGDKPLVVRLRGRMRTRSYLLTTPSGGRLRLEREVFFPKGSRRGLSILRAWAPRREEAAGLDRLKGLLRDRAALPPTGGHLAALVPGAPGAVVPFPAALGEVPLEPQMPMAEAGRNLLGRQVVRMEAFIPWALRDLHPEFVHDARVATRRARTLLRLAGPALGPKRAESLRRELRWAAALLGEVRDLDVFLEVLERYLGELPPEVPAPQRLLERFQEDRRTALLALQDGFSGRSLLLLLERLRRLVLSPPPRNPRGAGAEKAGMAARRMARRQVRRALKAAKALGPAPLPEALHRLRILFKRARYALEFFREVLPGEAEACIEAATAVQEVLGAHQDAVVALGRLREAARRSDLPSEELVASGVLLQRFWQSADLARGTLEEGLRRFRRSWRRLRRRLPKPPGETSGALRP